LLLAVALLSRWGYLIWASPALGKYGHVAGGVSHGCFVVCRVDESEVDPRMLGWHMELNFAKLYWWFEWRKSGSYAGLTIPLWVFMLPAAAITLNTFPRRRRPGHCPCCSYDLRGLPPGSACPECGPTQEC
jgi:hypothetical protein